MATEIVGWAMAIFAIGVVLLIVLAIPLRLFVYAISTVTGKDKCERCGRHIKTPYCSHCGFVQSWSSRLY